MKTVVTLLIGLLSLAFFYYLFFKAYQYAFGKGFLKQLFTKKFTIIFSAIAFVGLLLVIYCVSQNKFVYYWDYGAYWTNSYSFNNSLYENPIGAIKQLVLSTWNSDYNLVLPLLISLPLRILGFSFMRYVIINYLLFILPAIIVLISIYVKISSRKKTLSIALPLFAAATFVYPLFPMMKGYIDIALLIPISLLFALAINYDALKPFRTNKKQNLIIGILLVITFIFRRYAAFFLVGYIASLAIYSISTLIKSRKKRNIKKLIKNVILNYLSIGLIALSIMLIFFAPLIFRILGNNYSEAYVAYDLPLMEKTYLLIQRVGIIVCLLAIIGVICSIITKKHTKIICILSLSLLITTAAFFKVQRMDPHHVYVVTCQFAILSFFGLLFIFQQKNKIIKAIPALLLLIQPAALAIAPIQNIIKPVAVLFNEPYHPFIRNDMDELQRLVNDLNSKNDGKIYVLASSGILNSDILNSFNKPYSSQAVPELLPTHDVDLRDGFPDDFLTANIIVNASPIQLHLAEGTQEVVRYLSEQIDDSSSYLSDNYEKLDYIYRLDNDVIVSIYRKVKDFDNDDYEKMIDYYGSYYPNNPELFSDRIKKHITE